MPRIVLHDYELFSKQTNVIGLFSQVSVSKARRKINISEVLQSCPGILMVQPGLLKRKRKYRPKYLENKMKLHVFDLFWTKMITKNILSIINYAQRYWNLKKKISYFVPSRRYNI